MTLQLVQRSERTPQTAFMERYEGLLNWALRLTHGERSEAEDILHDAYVQFQRLGTRLEDIQNVDAYLHRTVRNLHLSRVMRRSRNPLVELDAFEYDTLELGVDAVDPFRLVAVQSELFVVCEWACSRRTETRAASILLLRFFLRYLPSEIAMLCRCNRQGVEKSLQLARRELRQVLKEEKTHGAAETSPAVRINHYRTSEAVQEIYREDHLNTVLWQKIFSTPLGACFSSEQLELLYGGENPPDRFALAHITSCRECLERVNRYLQLSALSERGDGDDDLSGGTASGSAHRGRSSRPNNSAMALLHRAERSANVLFEHRPERLSVHLDGERRASLALQGIENEFTIEVGRTRQVSFVEVFSEQGLLLAYLPITPLDEGGDFSQSTNMAFSEGRELCVELCFSQPRPRIALTYHDPLLVELRDLSHIFPVQSELNKDTAQAQALDLLQEWWRHTRSLLKLPFQNVPRVIFTLTALLLIFLLPVLQIKHTTLSAETLLLKAESWQTAAEGALVLHRTFHYEEHAEKNRAGSKKRRVEVWRQKNGRILRRMYDESGLLLASVAGNAHGQVNLSTAWQYEPSADAFKIVSSGSKMGAEEQQSRYVMRSASSELELDKDTYRPVRMILHFGEMKVEMVEIATETLPVINTPLIEKAASLAGSGHNEMGSIPVDLDLAEIMVRSRLHELKADLGEDIRVIRSGNVIVVSGVIAPESRRSELGAGLRTLPNVAVTLKSPEETARSGSIHRVIDRSGEPSTDPVLQEWMQARYPREDERSSFVNRALSHIDQSMWHSRALQSLVKRYGSLSEPTVHAIGSDHLARLSEEVVLMQRWVGDLPGDSSPPMQVSIPPTVAGKVQLIAETSRQLDDEMAELLTAHTLLPGAKDHRVEDLIRLCREHLQLLNDLILQLR